ncbi:MAG TPA: hypothetical protein VG735_00380 [Caulobacterales bacterium]|nr:hypothetical protein [Caulobacterales bacterium]
MTPPDDHPYNDWSAVEKEPVQPVVMGGAGGGHPGHAGAALRVLGSIWLVTLMFVFVALAAGSVASWAYYNLQLTKDSVKKEQLARVTDLMEYKNQLDNWRETMSNERSVVINPPNKPTLWLEIESLRDDNEALRKTNKQANQVANTARNPREPECLDPTRRRC